MKRFNIKEWQDKHVINEDKFRNMPTPDLLKHIVGYATLLEDMYKKKNQLIPNNVKTLVDMVNALKNKK